jgi:hypothetical protein
MQSTKERNAQTYKICRRQLAKNRTINYPIVGEIA